MNTNTVAYLAISAAIVSLFYSVLVHTALSTLTSVITSIFQ